MTSPRRIRVGDLFLSPVEIIPLRKPSMLTTGYSNQTIVAGA